ncbi:uncharacterized protein LOC119733618 [Patiria miniata]|uniref:Uncharacterized protein n=1 Tax=Patiria miniata TaxID=46514 RepID=A0A914AG55_PATMI|nr:uncharacterized protein LOC119733618 [Patiria miniata]
MWGLKNYISQRPEGEDSTSIERHQAAMKVELAKRNPDRSRVDRQMALTFADRREFIIKGNPLMADIKAGFPALLAGGSEVLKEFKRISTEDLGRKLATGLKRYHDRLFCLAKKQDHTVIKKLIELASLETTEENRREKAYCASIAVVPLLLKKKLDHLLTQQVHVRLCND